MKKISIEVRLKRAITSLKATEQMFIKIEKIKDEHPEVYVSNRYITNPRIGLLYNEADDSVNSMAKHYKVHQNDIVAMINNLNSDIDSVREYLLKLIANSKKPR